MTSPPPSPDGLLQPGEAARRLGVSTLTLSRWVQQGQLTAAPSTTSWARYYEREVEMFAEIRRLRRDCRQLRDARDDATAHIARIRHVLDRVLLELASA